MRTLIVSCLSALLLSGCVSQESRQRYFADQQRELSKVYRTGMTRDEVHAYFSPGKPLAFISRPGIGWSPSERGDYDSERAAFHFEQAHPDQPVQVCEVYWVSRGSSVPMAIGGVYFDYLYFDRGDKLVGFHRRFVD